VHSDEFIRKTLKLGKGTSFIDVIGPNDIAYVIAVFKNSQEMWDQDIQMRELGKDAMGNPEKKISPNFTSGSGQKRAKGKTLWNKEGMRCFRNAEKTWTKIFDSEEDMKVIIQRMGGVDSVEGKGDCGWRWVKKDFSLHYGFMV